MVTVRRRELFRMAAVGTLGAAVGGVTVAAIEADRNTMLFAHTRIPQERRNRARLVAQDIVGVDATGADVRAHYASLLVGNGPQPATTPLDIAVVGAGVSGLASAWMLAQAGHRVRVLEGSDRFGGRIRTLREPFARTGGHAEAGAMRIPTSHTLTTGVLRRLRVPTRPFLLSHPNRVVQACGKRLTRSEYDNDPAQIADVFGLDPVHGRALLDRALHSADITSDSGVDEWAEFLARHDELSLRDWLLDRRLTDQHIDYLGSTEGLTARMGLSLTHNMMTAAYLGPGTELVEIIDGTDRLTSELGFNALAAGAELQTNAEVTRIDGRDGRVRLTYGPDAAQLEADRVVVTVPFSLLRHMTFTPSLSYGKQRAIAELHHDAATKTFLEFGTRWWDGHGGVDVTDAAPRVSVYPSHPVGDGGVVIASYTWSDDARAWDALPPEHRAAECLDHLTERYGDQVRQAWTGGFASHSWAQDRWAAGEAAVYMPGQAVEIGPDTRTTEMDGRIAFAGDGTSTRGRAWIEGALESAARACTDLGVTARQA
ncbi:NAD(P)-binding protein [Nocardia uniformis]|uniref:NAD(P)-binding protein n=1 Tax=Nocardia uniformis TaxID=53432 RepID=A0A849BZD8_9NOCA|nr:NAD(P)/FAD-dependent oxidoreductase [Nocardia uniformis]NNH69017.1 NAD(P)-binding protein [Nocardia uniformis]